MKTDRLKLQFNAITEVMDYMERQIRQIAQEYADTGETRLKYKWVGGKHVPDLDEDGIQKTEAIYDYIEKNPASLSSEERMTIEVWNELQELFMKVIKEALAKK